MIEIEREIMGRVTFYLPNLRDLLKRNVGRGQKGRKFLGFLIKKFAKMERGTILCQSSSGALSPFALFLPHKFWGTQHYKLTIFFFF